MLSILGDVTITCFLTSYLVVLVLELSQLAGRIPGRGFLTMLMMGIGLFTHLCYLVVGASEDSGRGAGLWATWTDWSLLLALTLALFFAVFHLRRPNTVVSFFFLPAILAMIALGLLMRDRPPFSRSEATQLWRSVHGFSMMMGSFVVMVGFLAGVMYLIQSRRLKNHRAGSTLRLPTLETLDRLNRRSLVISCLLVGMGTVAGVIMNLNGTGKIGWIDGGVMLSSLLLVWLIAATLLEHLYPPAKQARKAVYLTLASLGFLVLTLVGVLGTGHGMGSADPVSTSPVSTSPVAAANSTAVDSARANSTVGPRP